MPLNTDAKKNIIKKVISNQDYRDEVLIIIDEIFLDYCICFFKQVVYAKIDTLGELSDWYKKVFLNPDLPKEQIAINSGLNMKSITNAYNSSKKEVVIQASNDNYIRLQNTIEDLVANGNNFEVKLSIKFKDVSVDLTVAESLIVINTIAVKRAEIRGGMWSAVGKQVEKPLMTTLCMLFNVPFEYHKQDGNPASFREVDFYVLSKDGKKLRTEVKLMGKGNPESADSIFAREPAIFLADKLSDRNKQQAEMLNVQWIELRFADGYRRFQDVLNALNVPNSDFNGDLNARLDEILKEIYGG
ncbi:MAG: CfrBI family restriction endonuclease [Sphingobacteriia bacterium]|nr:CfrBI family restriction endonuclease [Sphingobacteriia bacterium]